MYTYNPISGVLDLVGEGGTITVVANFSALPAPATVSGEFYWCSASQGTAWLPGSLGGTYYSAGLYYSNGVSWEFMDVPYQATQAEVNAGVVTDKFVTPNTFNNSTQLAARELTANKDVSGGYVGLTLLKINFKNVANTITSFFTNTNTLARTYAFQDGDGTVAFLTDIPAVTPAALTKADDTNVTLTLGGTPATSLLQATSITAGWTGTLADARITSAATWNAKVDSVSGTLNRITSTGGTTPVIDISATFEALLGKVANPLSQFAATTSDQLRGVISDETGSGGSLVFATGPTLSNPIVGTQTALDNSTKAASTAYVDALVVSPKIKSGVVAFGSFAGNPKKATVTFVTAFADANYSVSLIGVNARTWSVESYVAGSFVINANSNPALTGNTYWTAIKHGEN